MAITPNTNLRLLKCPIEADNKNQINFSNASAQYTYFNSLPKLSVDDDDFSYQRKDSIIAYPEHIDNIMEYNYCMYQNENYSNKWFYAFITDMRYENDGLTYITIKTDVYQTWQFDITFKASFVEREHVNDDTIGKNVIPEGLQLGEYVANSKAQWLNSPDAIFTPNGNLVIIIGVTQKYNGSSWENQSGVITDGIYQGLRYYVFNFSDVSTLNSWLDTYAGAGKSDAIKCMFILPKILTSGADREDHLYAGSNTTVTKYINVSSGGSSNKTIDFSNILDNYVPKNNKLKTFPYCFLLASNNSGSDVVYRYEDFYTVSSGVKTIQTPSFQIDSSITPSGSIRMIPRNYKGVAQNDNEGLNMGKFPICNWTTDVYTNWLTQNAVNIPLSIAGSTVGIVAGAVTGNPIGVASGVIGIANTLGEIYKESLVPPQSEGNINCGDVVTASGNNDFHFQTMSIKKEQLQIIDDYFSMFGYKVNATKVPNLTGRTNWNFVKTIDANIEGDIPQADIEEIKQIFNSGVTIWHNTSHYLDYTQTNNIIS